MRRRRFVALGCARCAALGMFGALHAAAGTPDAWSPPARFAPPAADSDEGGLWALMEREERRLRRSPFRIADDGLHAYLQALACRLAGAHCPDVRVYAMRTPFFNASMAPNGMMQVWSGLLLRLDNEAQLAAVVAHELGHFMQRHMLAKLRDAKSRSAFGTFLNMFGIVGALGSLAVVAGAFSFSREQEREADLIGLSLMERAGYDPREAATVWGNLMAELASNPGADPATSSPMFATHPASDERRRALEEAAAGRGGELAAAAYAERIAPLRAEWLADELARGHPAETLVLLERLLRREPQRALLLYFRGETRRLRAQPGDDELAVADLRAAVQAGGEPPAAHRSLGYLLRARGEAEAARAAFGRYLELTPQAPDAALIRQYLEEGRTS